MNKTDALKELTQVESRLKELRKIIEQPDNITDRVATLEDHIIKKLGETSDNDMFQFYYDMGLMLDNIAISYFDIYLD